MVISERQIKSHEIAIVCATKNQPYKIKNLLLSISNQTEKPGQVLISEGGDHLYDYDCTKLKTVDFKCKKSPKSGQVLQRNYAYTLLNKNIKVVMNFDDDIVLDNDCLEKFIKTWNYISTICERPLGGMSLNIINYVNKKGGMLRKLGLMVPLKAGGITSSGYAESIYPITRDIKAEWLVGGCTAWHIEVVLSIKHPIDFKTKWAVFEDVIFSSKVNEKFDLYVSHSAKVKHMQEYQNLSKGKAIFYGRSQVIMRHFFLDTYSGASRVAFLWTAIFQNLVYLFKGKHFLWMGIGGIIALLQLSFNYFFGKRSAKELARELGR